jgi:ABC-type multidrug transport system permease subunit
MEKKIFGILIVIFALYCGVLLFNHFNPWLGILTIIVVIYATFKFIYNKYLKL